MRDAVDEAFQPSAGPQRIGLELEMHLSEPVPALPRWASYEPGGQLELSLPPQRSVSDLLELVESCLHPTRDDRPRGRRPVARARRGAAGAGDAALPQHAGALRPRRRRRPADDAADRARSRSASTSCPVTPVASSGWWPTWRGRRWSRRTAARSSAPDLAGRWTRPARRTTAGTWTRSTRSAPTSRSPERASRLPIPEALDDDVPPRHDLPAGAAAGWLPRAALPRLPASDRASCWSAIWTLMYDERVRREALELLLPTLPTTRTSGGSADPTDLLDDRRCPDRGGGMKTLFVVDPLDGLDASLDTSIGLMHAAQDLGSEVWVATAARPRAP